MGWTGRKYREISRNIGDIFEKLPKISIEPVIDEYRVRAGQYAKFPKIFDISNTIYNIPKTQETKTTKHQTPNKTAKFETRQEKDT